MIEDRAYSHLKEARDALRSRKRDYDDFERYYEGDHDLAFASERWRNVFGPIFQLLRDNLCELVVNALIARTQVEGFSVRSTARDEGLTNPDNIGRLPEPLVPPMTDEDALSPATPPPPKPQPGQTERLKAEDIWAYNRMDAIHREPMQEAAIKGDGYVIVWPNDEGRACIYPNDADTVYCKYDPEHPGEMEWAVKLWVEGERLRATVYYDDRLEKYITTESAKLDPKGPEGWEPYIPIHSETVEDEEYGEYVAPVEEEWPLPNPYDKVPVFHFRNGGKSGQCGRSELAPVLPLQDALNKAIMDLMVAAEFLGYPQRYAVGLEPPKNNEGEPQPNPDLKPGMDQVWALWGEQVKLGEFSAADLSHHIALCNDLRAEIGRVSDTPPHMLFMFTGDIPSGEALKVVESPFTAKVDSRCTQWGNTWEDVIAFAVLVDTKGEMVVTYDAEWKDAQPKSLKETAETAVLWQQAGIPERVIWRDLLGFNERQCDEMERMKKAAAARSPSLAGIMDAAAQNESQLNGQLQPRGVTPPALAPFAAATQRVGAGGE